jgi:hypothetical protein
MHPEKSGEKLAVRRTLIASKRLARLGKVEGLTLGVVVATETDSQEKVTVLKIQTGAERELVVAVKGMARSLAGRLIIANPGERSVMKLEGSSDCFSILMPISEFEGFSFDESLISSDGRRRCPVCAGNKRVRDLASHLAQLHKFEIFWRRRAMGKGSRDRR